MRIEYIDQPLSRLAGPVPGSASTVIRHNMRDPRATTERESSCAPRGKSPCGRAACAIGARKREKVKAKEKAETLSTKGYPAANLAFLGTAMLPSQLTAAAVLRRSIKPEWLKHTQSVEGAKGLLLELMKSPAHSAHELAAATPSQMLLLLDFAMPMLRRLSQHDYYVLMRRCRKED